MVTDFNLSRIPKTYFGAGKIRLLPGLLSKAGKNILLISGGRSFVSSPQFKILKGEIEKLGLEYKHYRLSDEPSPFLIDGIVNENRGKKFGIVIAIGGGSVLDAGKSISAMLTQETSIMEYLEDVGTGKIYNGEKLPFIAIPTTSGTGSECTKNAVLSISGPNGFKKSLRHENLIPDIAIIDPKLTLSCPQNITAACAMDAFTQLLESFVSLRASEFTDSLALEGLRHISISLLKSYDEPDNLNARSSMSYAAYLSGITLANAGLGIIHGFASSIGGKVAAPHGVVCGTLMGSATRVNIRELQKKGRKNESLNKYARVGQLFTNIKRKDSIYYSNLLADTVDNWIEKLNIPKLGAYGLNQGDIVALVRATGRKENPVELDESLLTEIISQRI